MEIQATKFKIPFVLGGIYLYRGGTNIGDVRMLILVDGRYRMIDLIKGETHNDWATRQSAEADMDIYTYAPNTKLVIGA